MTQVLTAAVLSAASTVQVISRENGYVVHVAVDRGDGKPKTLWLTDQEAIILANTVANYQNSIPAPVPTGATQITEI